MNKNDQILDELFRSKLDNLEKSPSPDVWERIRERQMKAKRPGIYRILRLGGVAAAFLLAFFIGKNLMEEPHQGNPMVSDVKPYTATENEAIDSINTSTSVDSQDSEVTFDYQVTQVPVVVIDSPIEYAFVQENNERNTHGKFVDEFPLTENAKINSLSGLIEIKESGLMRKLVQNRNSKYKELSAIEKMIVAMNTNYAKSNTKRSNEWSVGAYFNPAYSVNHSSNSADYSRNTYVNNEKAYMNVGGGLLVDYHLDKRWSIQSGLLMSNFSQTASNHSRFQSDEVKMMSSPIALFGMDRSVSIENTPLVLQTYNSTEGPASYFLNSSVGVVQLSETARLAENNWANVLPVNGMEQNFTYLEVPLYFKYQLIDKIFGIDVSGGFSTNILVGNKVYMGSGAGKTNAGKTQDMKEFSYSTGIGLGMNYKFMDNLSAQIQPVFKYYLHSLSKNPEVNFKPYSFGFQAGVSYRFGK